MNMGNKIVQFLDKLGNAIYPKTYSKVLYSGNSNGTITLSDTATNYEYIEIFFRNSDNFCNSVKVYQPNGKAVALVSNTAQAGVTYWKNRAVLISGSTISTYQNQYNETYATGGAVTVSPNNVIFITRVVGYK